jgi:WD40 repeat protein
MLPPIDLNSLIQTITGIASPILKDKLLRNEEVIKILQKFNLAPEHPPSDFSGIYAYALVEYGIGKPKIFLELFRDEEIKKSFRKAFDNNTPSIILSEINNYLDTHALINDIIKLGIDPRRELAAFYLVFCKVAKTSRTPSDILLSQQIITLNQKLDRIPTLEGMRAEIALLLSQQDNFALPSSKEAPTPQCKAMALAEQMRGWLETLGYKFEKQEIWRQDYFEWIINIPVRRNRYDRVLIRGIAGEAQVSDVLAIRSSVEKERADEGWLVTARRISRAARTEVDKEENKHLGCYTFDEFLAQDADFSGYLDWLETEIKRRQIDTKYVPLACTKEEIDSVTGRQIAVSRYEEEDGWIDGYIDRWLDDPAKEHISVLGEFGTGKTWFAFHYAWVALQRYKDALNRGVELPRLPLVIPLRDYAKAVSVESLFSEFFFRKHEIPLPGYSAFEQLNRMGKLLLIFDGFDEMAARIDRQEMINNFWELAKVVVPGAKVILTCRSEHFPEAKEGRALLNAELQASTALLTGETPQFEVLELEKFNDEQIKQVLLYQATSTTVEQVMSNPQLLDLARRPVMTELILEALPDIEAGKPVDMSRVYLYAVRRKIENDITQKRTFTSSAEKLYFLCELSWEMLSTDQMSLNYRLFPDRIRRLFGAAVQEEKDLDHWQFDMMGQTMLIRNADGDYTPAHRSLLEFFVAYKFAAEIGALADDFTELARGQLGNVVPRSFTWSSYFGKDLAPLDKFVAEPLEKLRNTFGKAPLSKAVLDLMAPMVDVESVIEVIQGTRGFTEDEVGYVGGNAATLAVKVNKTALEGKNLSCTIVKKADFSTASLHNVNFYQANLADSYFAKVFGRVLSTAFSPNSDIFAIGDANGIINILQVDNSEETFYLQGHTDWIRSLKISNNGHILVSAGDDFTIKIWDLRSKKCLKTLLGHSNRVYSVAISPDNNIIASSSTDQTIKIWDVNTGECLKTLQGHSRVVYSVAISKDNTILVSSSWDETIKIWNLKTGELLKNIHGNLEKVLSIDISSDGTAIISAGSEKTIKVWDINTGVCIQKLEGHTDRLQSITFSPDSKMIASGSLDTTIKLWDSSSGKCIQTLYGHKNSVWSVAFNPNGKSLISASSDSSIKYWDIHSGKCIKTLQGYTSVVYSITISNDSKLLVSSGDDSSIKIWDIITGNYITTLQGHTSRVWSVTINLDKTLLASGGSDGKVKLWDMHTGKCLKTMYVHKEGETSAVYSVAISLDNTFIASSHGNRTIMLWDIITGKHLKTLHGHTGRVWSVSISSDNKTLVSSGDDNIIRIWDITTGKCLKLLQGHTSGVNSVLISVDRKNLFSASNDNNIKVWDINSGDCIKTLEGHTSRVLSISLTNTTLASSSSDKTIRLWDTITGKCLNILQGHTNSVWSVAMSSDAKILASGSADQTIKIWDVQSGNCIRTLDNKPYAGMNITGATGLTAAEKATLKALGAIDEQDL